MKIDRSFARNINFEVANSEVHEKAPRKTSTLKLQSAKICGTLSRNGRFEVPTGLLTLLSGFKSVYEGSNNSRRVYGGSCKILSFSTVSKQTVMSFCVAGVAPGDILTCLKKCRKSFV